MSDDKLEQALLNKGNVCDDYELMTGDACDPTTLEQYVLSTKAVTSEEMVTQTKAKIFELLSNKLTNMFVQESHLVKPAYENITDKYFDMMIREMVERVRAYADMRYMNDTETEVKAVVHSVGNYILEFETPTKHTELFADLLVDVINQYDLNNKLSDTFITASLLMTQKYLNLMSDIGWSNVVGYGVLVPAKKDKEVEWSLDYGKYHLPIKVSVMVKSTPVYLRTFYLYAIANQ
jgi:hypothetical protein